MISTPSYIQRALIYLATSLVASACVPALGVAQTPAPTVSLGYGVDTLDADVGRIVRLVRAYLAAPDSTVRTHGIWQSRKPDDHTQDDLAARYALQGAPATVVGVLPTDSADTAYIVKIVHARTLRDGGTGLVAVQRLYAVRSAGGPFGWQLATPLPRLTRAWATHVVGRITFHYAPGQRTDAARATIASRFVDSVAALFEVQPPRRIDYFVTQSADEYFRALGLDFFVLPSGRGQSASGNALPDAHVLLAGDPAQGELFRHELVHVALGSRIKSGFINEGVAAWLGGSRGRIGADLYRRLAAFQRTHANLTFSKVVGDKLSVPSDPEGSSDAWYASGELVCEYVYRRAGLKGLRALANAPKDLPALQVLLARLLELPNSQDALDKWWRAAS